MSVANKIDLKTSILFLVFNRLDTTKKVFESIKKARPQKLYIASDGPRNSVMEEFQIVKDVRQAVLENIDWPCEIKTLFRDTNLGCKKAVEGAIDWFFANEEMGIILEDDCLPSQSFFLYCEENLMKYKNDTRITALTGNNFYKNEITDHSYFCSRFAYIWGWATWRRSWLSHKIFLNNFEKIIKSSSLNLGIPQKKASLMIIYNAKRAFSGEVDTWDYQWILSNYLNHGLIITPERNLVKNIGFSKNATHTKTFVEELVVEKMELTFPLNHPLVMTPNMEYDTFLYNNLFQWVSFFDKLIDIKNLPKRIKNSYNRYKFK